MSIDVEFRFNCSNEEDIMKRKEEKLYLEENSEEKISNEKPEMLQKKIKFDLDKEAAKMSQTSKKKDLDKDDEEKIFHWEHIYWIKARELYFTFETLAKIEIDDKNPLAK